MSEIDLIGKKNYDLLYNHYDSAGNKIEDFEDVLFCEDDDISLDRIEKLIPLLKPVSKAEKTLIPLEAAKVLAAWGVSDAIEYYKYCIDNRIDKLGNLSPHRIYGYDTTYEEIIDSLTNYYARHADISIDAGEEAYKKIQPLLKKIIKISKEIPFNLLSLIKIINRKNWRDFESDLKECFVDFSTKTNGDRITNNNAKDIEELLLVWDPEFIISSR